MTVTDFLLACIAEDEAVAREVFLFHSSPWSVSPGPAGWSVIRSVGVVVDDEFGDGAPHVHDTHVLQIDTTSTAAHIARHDPARVLAECEAKRLAIEAAWRDHVRIENEWGSCQTREQMEAADDYPMVVLALAQVYRDRPGWREEWAL